MKFLTIRLLLLLAVCAFLAPLAHADDSQVFDTGKNVYPINNDNIRMVSEKVTIHRRNDPIRGRIANVDCEFIFENITDEVQTVKVGFPGLTCEPTNSFCTPGLRKFVSYIDGKEVPVDIKEEIRTYSYYELDKEGKRVPAEGYTKRNWYTWDVTFPPKSTMNLRNSYETLVSGESDGHHALVYILKTGANWSGTIGSATIEVIYDDEDFMKGRVVKAQPEGYEISGNKITWKLNNFTPQENIVIDEISDYLVRVFSADKHFNYFNSKKYEGAERLYTRDDMVSPVPKEKILPALYYPIIDRDTLSEDVDRTYVAFLKKEIYARHGKTDSDPGFDSVFIPKSYAISWFKYNPNYSDDMLNDIEKQNIKFIEDYEKEKGWR